ncbi:MAG: type II toxin-antitoxin system death-on-curing family toxin [Christensenellales bacterium]|jgi:death-on-curing protein|nr:type II toxin-antitoxin system death-on-curing family toxin [Clostridiales bacterium]
MIGLSKEQVILLHQQLIKETGGMSGIRDEGLLESALKSPFVTFEGAELYPSILQKAARLCYGLVANHPFFDGNKRIAAHVMLIFLSLNNVELEYTQDDLINIILSVAKGNADTSTLLQWIHKHLQ